MPSNISQARRTKAFDEGRRSAKDSKAENPYANVKLQKLWEQGRAQQLSGQISTPIPALEHGETRAQRPLPKALRPASPPRGNFGRSGFGNQGRDRRRP
jgi:hypothetical protein